MLQTPPNLTVADIKQWYERTWVSVEGFDGPRYVSNVVAADHIRHHGQKEAQEQVASATAVRGWWPRLGAVNLPAHMGFAMYVTRRIAKSYRRSFTLEVLKADVPHSWTVANFAGIQHKGTFHQSESWLRSVSWSIAESLWSSKYPSFSEAVSTIVRDEAISVALSRTIIIVETSRNEKLSVFHNGLSVGYSDFLGRFTPTANLNACVITTIQKKLGTYAYAV